jgi:hypothetical protein
MRLDVSSTGKDDSNLGVGYRLAKRVAQLSEAFEHVRRARVEMPSDSVLQSTLKNQDKERTEVTPSEFVQYLPVLWIDDLDCLDSRFATSLVQSLFLFPFPAILTVSEPDGLSRIMNGTQQCFGACPTFRIFIVFAHCRPLSRCVRLWYCRPPAETP